MWCKYKNFLKFILKKYSSSFKTLRFCPRPATRQPRVTELTLDGCLSRKWDFPKVDVANFCEVPVVLGSNPADRHTSTGGLVALSNEDDFYVGGLLTWWNKKLTKKNNCQCADPGCLFRIPNPYFFHPESRIRIKEFKYFNPKIVSKLSVIWSGLFIPDPVPGSGSWYFYPSRIRG